jgi:hypothetical protein
MVGMAAPVSVMIVVITQTKDFTTWKRVFDARAEMRIRGGCRSSVVYRDPADPTRVVVMNHMPDLETARRYVRSPELVDAMYEAGVLGAPQIAILEQVDAQDYSLTGA